MSAGLHGPGAWRFLGLALASGMACGAVAPTPARALRSAETLRFDVTGAITPSCTLVAERIRIDLGEVPLADLPSVGDGSSWRAAAFIGAECVGATRASVVMRALAAAEDPRYLATAGEARGVAIEMRTGSGQPVLPDGLSPVAFELGGIAPELRFEARYVRVGPLKPGNALGTALVQITWE
ncbi:MAG TPA: fimbrial protein [Luteibacter sp.]|uniref:fimbrial protein n=1 Tax=Luteibacter sp. TaxID=1886636 RepID=UPI002C941246|nr:fimbrial protein [Luteibacter sp.]HVI55931.1 fimbrial protein [Luteibacter sp.]